MEAALARTRMLRALSSRQLLQQSRSLGGSGSVSVRGIASPAEALSYHPNHASNKQQQQQQQTATPTGSPPLPGVCVCAVAAV